MVWVRTWRTDKYFRILPAEQPEQSIMVSRNIFTINHNSFVQIRKCTELASSIFFGIEWPISSTKSQLIPAQSTKPDDIDRRSGWIGTRELCWEIQMKTRFIFNMISLPTCTSQRYMLHADTVARTDQCWYSIIYFAVGTYALHGQQISLMP